MVLSSLLCHRTTHWLLTPLPSPPLQLLSFVSGAMQIGLINIYGPSSSLLSATRRGRRPGSMQRCSQQYPGFGLNRPTKFFGGNHEEKQTAGWTRRDRARGVERYWKSFVLSIIMSGSFFGSSPVVRLRRQAGSTEAPCNENPRTIVTATTATGLHAFLYVCR